jgi:hypothetical protein
MHLILPFIVSAKTGVSPLSKRKGHPPQRCRAGMPCRLTPICQYGFLRGSRKCVSGGMFLLFRLEVVIFIFGLYI